MDSIVAIGVRLKSRQRLKRLTDSEIQESPYQTPAGMVGCVAAHLTN